MTNTQISLPESNRENNGERTLAVIASTMRSGSTLLKALLQEAPDVSRLSEVNFQRYSEPKRQPAMWKLDDRPILLLKRPAWYHEASRYPKLPEVSRLRVIALVRDCYETVESLRKMTFRFAQAVAAPLADRWFATRYWATVTLRLTNLAALDPQRVRLVRYEDLVARPVEVTAGLFQFLGSQNETGVDSYSPPENYQWRWGTDDNSPRIRSLSVQAPRQKPHANRRLESVVNSTTQIVELRQRLGYIT